MVSNENDILKVFRTLDDLILCTLYVACILYIESVGVLSDLDTSKIPLPIIPGGEFDDLSGTSFSSCNYSDNSM